MTLLDSIIRKVEWLADRAPISAEYLAGHFHTHRRRYLTISMPKNMLIRGQILADDLMDIWDDDEDEPPMIHVGSLVTLVYLDFLRYIKQGVPRKTLLEHLEHIASAHRYEDFVEFRSVSPHHTERHLRTKRSESTHLASIRVRMQEKDVLRGEMLLYELSEMDAQFELEIEDIISLLYQDFIQRQQGKSTKAIIQTIVNYLDVLM